MVPAAVTLQATSGTVDQPGDSADVCVVLDSGGATIAGTENALAWDPSCATLPDASACRVNPDTGKQLNGRIQADFTYKALVLSLFDVAPIPDGTLYCCTFRVDAAPGRCCSLQVIRAIASDPGGSPIPVQGSTGMLCVRGGGSVSSPTPTATPIPPVSTQDDDGCQVGPQPVHPATALAVLAATFWLITRTRRDRR